jgi:hypothetical protein
MNQPYQRPSQRKASGFGPLLLLDPSQNTLKALS